MCVNLVYKYTKHKKLRRLHVIAILYAGTYYITICDNYIGYVSVPVICGVMCVTINHTQ